MNDLARKNDLVGKNTVITLSTSGLDSATLLGSHVRFHIPAGMNPFRGPREIPRFLNGVFVNEFRPQVLIPANHPRGEIIRRTADYFQAIPAYLSWSDFIEH